MKGVLQLALGVMTAIGGFVDIGNLVTSGVTGARFGSSLVWAVLLGTLAMSVYGEMAGRVAAAARRPVFQEVRERLGLRTSLVTTAGTVVITLLAVSAQIGGAALVLQLATGINYLVWVPVVGLLAWIAVWRLPFAWLQNLTGLLGLSLLVFAAALFVLPMDWGTVVGQAAAPAVPGGESATSWWFYAVALFGACVAPYQVIFFASGGREQGWTPDSLGRMRLTALVGFPLGGLLSIAIMLAVLPVLGPDRVDVGSLGQVALPVAQAFGVAGLVAALLGFFAATFAAATEATLALGYSAAQYFGWPWGKDEPSTETARFDVLCLACVIAATGFVLTSIDPITVTIVVVTLGAVALPVSYLPILVVANDRAGMGRHANGRWSNAAGVGVLAVMTVAAVAALPLLLITKGGQ